MHTRCGSVFEFYMNTVFLVAHIGLYLVVVLEALAICVLYHKNTELLNLSMRGGGSSDLMGSQYAQFEALDVRSENVVSSSDILNQRTNILFVSSDCFVCQKLINELGGRCRYFVDRLDSCKLIIYCQGSFRGCARFLAELDANILTLSAHERDVAALFSVRTPPVLVEIDHPSGRIVNYTYPFSVDDFLASMNRSALWRSSAPD